MTRGSRSVAASSDKGTLIGSAMNLSIWVTVIFARPPCLTMRPIAHIASMDFGTLFWTSDAEFGIRTRRDRLSARVDDCRNSFAVHQAGLELPTAHGLQCIGVEAADFVERFGDPCGADLPVGLTMTCSTTVPQMPESIAACGYFTSADLLNTGATSAGFVPGGTSKRGSGASVSGVLAFGRQNG